MRRRPPPPSPRSARSPRGQRERPVPSAHGDKHRDQHLPVDGAGPAQRRRKGERAAGQRAVAAGAGVRRFRSVRQVRPRLATARRPTARTRPARPGEGRSVAQRGRGDAARQSSPKVATTPGRRAARRTARTRDRGAGAAAQPRSRQQGSDAGRRRASVEGRAAQGHRPP